MAQPARPPIRLGSVRLMQDAPLGSGAYGQVCRATLGELPCAAKLLHANPGNPRNRILFEQECRFLSKINHPNIVQYLGVAKDEKSGLPILLMELMDGSLTHFLAQSKEFLAYHVQVNISHDIALAVAFLHLNHIVHRDLSSSNVLLIGAGSRAKVTDFGMSKLTELNPHMTDLTKCPGNPVYMSPEALLDPPVYTEKLDCFQVGVLMLQTMTCKYPVPGPAMNRVRDTRSRTGWKIDPIPELRRRHNHLSLVAEIHPMLCLAKDCLKDTDTERPSAQQICQHLSALKEAPQYAQSFEGRRSEREGGESKEEGRREKRERVELIHQLRDKNQAREREVKNLRREVGVMLEKNEALKGVVQTREREVRDLRRLLHDKDRTNRQLKPQQFASSSYTCLVSGRGLQSASANHLTRVVVELSDPSGRPCSLEQNVTAELVLQSTSSQATPASHTQQPSTAVAMRSTSRYEVSYTAVRRGSYKLHVQVNGSEINGSPFMVTIYHDPTQLGSPVMVVKALNRLYGIAFNNCGEMIVTEWYSHQVAVFDDRRQSIRNFFGSRGEKAEQMKYPQGIAVDDTDNIYVSSKHKLQKFTGSGKLIKCIGWEGSKEGEFNDPRGVTIHSNQVYVCDADNHRIQVFDLELNYIRSIGSHGSGRGEFNRPLDVAFDTAGNMYIVEFDNSRVQVMDSSGQFVGMFDQEGEGKLSHPTALHIADKYVYVSDWSSHRIAVYKTSGQYVTSFGRHGEGEGEFSSPFCITSCINGFIYVCDSNNKRVQVF